MKKGGPHRRLALTSVLMVMLFNFPLMGIMLNIENLLVRSTAIFICWAVMIVLLMRIPLEASHDKTRNHE